MSLRTTTAAASASGFGANGLTQIGGGYWIGLFTPSSGNLFGTGSAVDSSNNIYFSSWGSPFLNTMKLTSAGAITWQRSVPSSSGATAGVGVNSASAVYFGGNFGATADFYGQKYDSTGALVWARTLGVATDTESVNDVHVDPTGNLYLVGLGVLSADGTSTMQWARYTSTAGSVLQRRITNAGNGCWGNGITSVDNGNIYAVGFAYTNLTNNYTQALIAKWTSAGSLSWQRTLTSSGTTPSDSAYDVALDASENVYVCAGASADAGATDNMVIAKYNSTGTIQWQRKLSGANSLSGRSVALDSSANVYVLSRGSTAANRSFITKYDTNGTIQWQRQIYMSKTPVLSTISVDSSGALVVSGQITNGFANANYRGIIMRLPTDGSKTGNYNVAGVGISYAPSTFTDSVGGLTAATSTYTSATSSLTNTVQSPTDSAGSITSAILY